MATRIAPTDLRPGDQIQVFQPGYGHWIETVNPAGHYPSEVRADVACISLGMVDCGRSAATLYRGSKYADWLAGTPADDLERIEDVFARLTDLHGGDLEEISEVVRRLGSPEVFAHWLTWATTR